MLELFDIPRLNLSAIYPPFQCLPMRLYMSVREPHYSSIEKSTGYRNGISFENKKKDLSPNRHRLLNQCYSVVVMEIGPKIKLKEGGEVYRYFHFLNILKPGECLMPHFIHFNIIQIPLISLTFGFPILASINRSS